MGLIAETRQDAILIWTLNREARLNALPDLTDGEEFAAACAEANADHGVRCVVLTGAGRAFCAGHDIRAAGQPEWVAEGLGKAQYQRRVMDRLGQIPVLMRALPKAGVTIEVARLP